MTNDIDVVVDIAASQIEAFCAEFPSAEFYVSRPAVESAVSKRFQFNIIHPTSGSKIDCIVAGSDPFVAGELQRGRLVKTVSGDIVRFASPEDVIIKKLEYFRLGESEKHLRDIAGIWQGQRESLDREYIRSWSEKKGLLDVWDAVLTRLGLA
jgi:hypothetical protein